MGIFALGVLFFTTPLPAMVGLWLLGADPIGRTDAVFAEATVAPLEAVAIPQQAPVQQVSLSLGQLGVWALQANPPNTTLTTSNTASGGRAAVASFTEAGLLQICQERSTLCGRGDGNYRNVSVDLRPDGAVIYAEVNAGVWQRVGVVVQLDETQTRFTVVGVDAGGVLYDANSLPADLRAIADEIEREGNIALGQLLLQSGGDAYRLNSIRVDDQTLTLVLR